MALRNGSFIYTLKMNFYKYTQSFAIVTEFEKPQWKLCVPKILPFLFSEGETEALGKGIYF